MSGAVDVGDSFSATRRALLILVLGSLSALGPLTIDLYLPALPAMAHELRATEGQIQWTLAGTTIGFAVGQATVGPLSDRYGRRRPLLWSVAVHLIASALVTVAPTVAMLLTARVLQGFGAAAGVVVSLAIARDLHGGPRLAVLLSRLALVTGIAPIVAPVLGAQIQTLAGWRMIFGVLTAFSMVVLLAVAASIPETGSLRNPPPAASISYRARYGSVLRDRRLWGAALIGGMNFTALFGYLASSPFLMQSVLGFDPAQYGLMFAVNSVGVVIGIQSAARLMRHRTPEAVLTAALPLMAFSVAAVLLWGTNDRPALILVLLFLYITFGGLCVPCIQLIALRDHAQNSGTAASVLGILNFGLAGVLAPILGLFPIVNAAPMAAYMLAANLVACAALTVFLRPGRSASRL